MSRWYGPVPMWLLLTVAAAVKDPVLFYDAPKQTPQISYEEPLRSPVLQEPILRLNQLEARALISQLLLKSLYGDTKQQPPKIQLIKRRPYEHDRNETAQTRPSQRTWKKKKGRYLGYEMCYFKLCSFRPKIMYDYNLE